MMSEKVAAPKTTSISQAKRKPALRKVAAKKSTAGALLQKNPKEAVELEKKVKQAKKKGSGLKVVRDSFSMPQSDYAKIGTLKQLCLKNGLQVKKSQLLRAGLQALEKLSAAQLKIALSSFAEESKK